MEQYGDVVKEEDLIPLRNQNFEFSIKPEKQKVVSWMLTDKALSRIRKHYKNYGREIFKLEHLRGEPTKEATVAKFNRFLSQLKAGVSDYRGL